MHSRDADPTDPDDPNEERVFIPMSDLLDEYIAENNPETLTNTISILLVPDSIHLAGSSLGVSHLIIQWH